MHTFNKWGKVIFLFLVLITLSFVFSEKPAEGTSYPSMPAPAPPEGCVFVPPLDIVDASVMALWNSTTSVKIYFETTASATCLVYYKTPAEGSWHTATIDELSGTLHRFAISGLTTSATYLFYLKAAGTVCYPGDCPPSGWDTFQMAATGPTANAGPDISYFDGELDYADNDQEDVPMNGSSISGVTTWTWSDGNFSHLPYREGGTPYVIPTVTLPVQSVTYTIFLRGKSLTTGLSAQDTALATIKANTIPTLTHAPPGATLTATVGTPFSVTFNGDAIDSGDIVTLTVAESVSWLPQTGGAGSRTAQQASLIFSATPGSSDVGSHSLQIHAEDRGHLFVDDSVTITVQPAPTPPVWDTPPTPTEEPKTVNATVGTAITSVTYQAHDAESAVTISYTGTLPPGITLNNNPNPGNPAIRTFSGTPTTAGTYSLTLRATDGALYAPDRHITFNVAEPPNNPPTFSAPPSGAVYRTPPGDSLNNGNGVTFTAADSPGQQVRLVVLSRPAWVTCDGSDTIPGNPISRTCRGTPSVTDIGGAPAPNLVLQAIDNGSPPLTTNREVTLHVSRFKDISWTALHQDGGFDYARKADAADFDNDGDIDLVLGRFNYWPGEGRWMLRNEGTFQNRTSTLFLLGDSSGDRAVKFGHQLATDPYNLLFMSGLSFLQSSSSPPGYKWYATSAPYRAKKGATTYSYESIVVGHTPYQYWAETSPYMMAAFASDIESGRVQSGYLHTFFANAVLGDPLPDDSDPGTDPQQFVLLESGDVFYWNDSMTSYGNIFPFRDASGNPENNPVSGDIELVDVDGDGDLDIAAGGVASYTGGPYVTFSWNPVSYRMEPVFNNVLISPGLWLNNGSGSFTRNNNLPSGLGWDASAGYPYFFEQKIVFADLDGDTKKDLIITDLQHNIKVFKNNSVPGSISFSQKTLPSLPPGYSIQSVVAGDIDNDGDRDLILFSSRPYADYLLWKNNGSFNFVDDTNALLPYGPSEAVEYKKQALLFDFDCDTDLDLFVADPWENMLFENKTLSGGVCH